jgi:hypothetical protein
MEPVVNLSPLINVDPHVPTTYVDRWRVVDRIDRGWFGYLLMRDDLTVVQIETQTGRADTSGTNVNHKIDLAAVRSVTHDCVLGRINRSVDQAASTARRIRGTNEMGGRGTSLARNESYYDEAGNQSDDKTTFGLRVSDSRLVVARGRTGGRPRLMTRAKLRTAMTMMADRTNAASDVAGQLGISLSTLYAYVDGEGRPKPRASKLLAR